MKPHNWGIDRLKLPEFTDRPTEELQEFLEAFFILKLPESFNYQNYFCTFFMSLMLIWGGLIILRSFLQGRWWLFRNQRTSSSSKLYLIPNSTTSFIFVEGLFFLFWIGYTYYSRAIDERQTSGKLRGYIMVPVWSLCWLGAWTGAIGTLYISPGILLRSEKERGRFSVKRLIPSPFVVNVLVIGFPIAICSGMVIGGVLGGVAYSKTWDRWESLNSDLLSQDPLAPTTSSQNTEALEIWKGVAEAYFRFSIGFFFLTFATLSLLVTYTGAAVYLVWTLRSQIQETELLFGRFRVPTTVNITDMEHRVAVWTSVRDQASEMAGAAEEARAVESTFFPPVRQPQPQLSNADSPEQRSKILREALSTILTLSLCINLAAVIFNGNTIYIAARCYESSLEGPKAMTTYHEVYHLLATWNSVVFGGLSFLLVLTRTYQTFFESRSMSNSSFRLSFLRTVERFKEKSSTSFGPRSKSKENGRCEGEFECTTLVVLGQDDEERVDRM